MADQEYYTLEEATAKLGKDADYLRKLVREGELREFRISGKFHYKASEIDALAGGKLK